MYKDNTILKGGPYLVLTILMLLAAIFVLFLFKMGECPPMKGFPISNRYFIYLTPVGIIASTLFSVYLWRAFKGLWWMQGLILTGIGYLVILRAFKTYSLVKGFYHF